MIKEKSIIKSLNPLSFEAAEKFRSQDKKPNQEKHQNLVSTICKINDTDITDKDDPSEKQIT